MCVVVVAECLLLTIHVRRLYSHVSHVRPFALYVFFVACIHLCVRYSFLVVLLCFGLFLHVHLYKSG